MNCSDNQKKFCLEIINEHTLLNIFMVRHLKFQCLVIYKLSNQDVISFGMMRSVLNRMKNKIKYFSNFYFSRHREKGGLFPLMNFDELGISQLRICRPPSLTFNQPFMDDGECAV